MKTTRREFLRNSAITSTGLFFVPSINSYAWEVDVEFDLEIGVCTNCAQSDILKGFGYSYIEESVQQFLVPLESEQNFLKNLDQAINASLPIKAVNLFLPGELKCVGRETNPAAIINYAETTFRRAQLAGIGIIVFGSGKSRQIPEGFSEKEARTQFVELCRKLAALAEKYKVTLVLEPLSKEGCNFINSVAEGGEIVQEVNHPNFQLLADFYHMAKEEESLENIIKYGHLLRHVHIAEKSGRSAPGTTPEDFTGYFQVLKKVNYKGLLSIECHWQNIEKQLPIAIQELRIQMAG